MLNPYLLTQNLTDSLNPWSLFYTKSSLSTKSQVFCAIIRLTEHGKSSQILTPVLKCHQEQPGGGSLKEGKFWFRTRANFIQNPEVWAFWPFLSFNLLFYIPKAVFPIPENIVPFQQLPCHNMVRKGRGAGITSWCLQRVLEVLAGTCYTNTGYYF